MKAEPLDDPRPLPASMRREITLEVGRDWPADGLGPVRDILAQLPDPAALAEGTLVVVRATGPTPPNAIARLFSRARQVHLAVRCTALLARGFAEIRAEQDILTREWVAIGAVPAPLAHDDSAQSA